MRTRAALACPSPGPGLPETKHRGTGARQVCGLEPAPQAGPGVGDTAPLSSAARTDHGSGPLLPFGGSAPSPAPPLPGLAAHPVAPTSSWPPLPWAQSGPTFLRHGSSCRAEDTLSRVPESTCPGSRGAPRACLPHPWNWLTRAASPPLLGAPIPEGISGITSPSTHTFRLCGSGLNPGP